MGTINPMPDLFGGLPGDKNGKLTVSLDGNAKVRARNKREYRNTTPEEFHGMIERAIAEGRHNPVGGWETVCSVCRKWVKSIVYVSPQNRLMRFCLDCAPEDVRADILAGRAQRRGATDDVAAAYGERPEEPPLPDGIERAEELGLPDQ